MWAEQTIHASILLAEQSIRTPRQRFQHRRQAETDTQTSNVLNHAIRAANHTGYWMLHTIDSTAKGQTPLSWVHSHEAHPHLLPIVFTLHPLAALFHPHSAPIHTAHLLFHASSLVANF